MDDANGTGGDFGDPGPESLPPIDVYEDLFIEPEPEQPVDNVVPLYSGAVEPEFPRKKTYSRGTSPARSTRTSRRPRSRRC